MKLNLGSGQSKLEGYTNCDIISMPGVDVVCSVDKLPFEDNSIEEILAEHLIEHFTYDQFHWAIVDWFRVLKPAGKLTIECPDFLELCRQFVEADEFGRYWRKNGYWALCFQAFGHQRGKTEEERLAQVHKSGYTFEHLSFILNGVGFSNITKEPFKKGPPGTPVMRLSCQKISAGKNKNA